MSEVGTTVVGGVVAVVVEVVDVVEVDEVVEVDVDVVDVALGRITVTGGSGAIGGVGAAPAAGRRRPTPRTDAPSSVITTVAERRSGYRSATEIPPTGAGRRRNADPSHLSSRDDRIPGSSRSGGSRARFRG